MLNFSPPWVRDDARVSRGGLPERLSLTPAVVIVGANRAGKTTVAQYLSKIFVATVVDFGDCVRRAQAVDPSLPEDTSAAFLVLRQRQGDQLLPRWAEAVKHGAPDTDQRTGLVMSGVRDVVSYEQLRKSHPAMLTVAVSAAQSVRFDRQRSDPARDGNMSFSAFRGRDRVHESWGLTEIEGSATLRLRNRGSLAFLKSQIHLNLAPTMKDRGFELR